MSGEKAKFLGVVRSKARHYFVCGLTYCQEFGNIFGGAYCLEAVVYRC